MKREAVFKNHYLGERAIVVGGGVAGLSAARAVSDRFRQVVIMDRDELPDAIGERERAVVVVRAVRDVDVGLVGVHDPRRVQSDSGREKARAARSQSGLDPRRPEQGA